jgi:hypothetical protein
MKNQPKTKQKTPPLNPKKIGSVMGKIGGAIKQVATIAAAHPTTAALFIMAGATIIRVAVIAGGKGKEPESMKPIMGELSNVYLGAQGIATAAALAPIVSSGIGLATSLMSKPKAAAAE